MSYDDLGYLGVKFRPIDVWPGELTRNRTRSPFSASWNTTLRELARELRMLGARNTVIQLAMSDRDIRIDGMPRSNARADHPGVILAFDSKFGPLKYATDTYTNYEDNVRAIALAMESLRAVDRYGVSKRGEQYQGWKALPSGSDDTYGIENAAAAREYLEERYAGDIKRALMETHPDRGGDRDEFGKVMRIKGLLSG